MTDDLLYLDSSALVKLVLPEVETAGLIAFLATWTALIASDLARVEVLRAVRRIGPDRATVERAEAVLNSVAMIPIDGVVLDAAANVEPAALRSLDAIHLATALTVQTDLAGPVTYDARLAEAARRAGIQVYAPGAVGAH